MTAARTVLVIEDDDEVRQLIADVLREIGHTVHCARDGSNALASLGAIDVQLILLDLTLPDMSGQEFLRHREGIPQAAAVPVVILSGSDDASAFGAGRRIPVLRKPFHAVELIHAVEGQG